MTTTAEDKSREHSNVCPAGRLSLTPHGVWEVVCVWIAALVTSSGFCWPVFRDIENFGLGDWDQHFFYHGVGRKAVVEFGQVPGWNPYYFGGTVCLANPQSRVFAPGFTLVCTLGVAAGLKLDIMLHLAVGLAGAYFLGRRLGLGRPAAMVTSMVAALNGAYFWNLAVGHTWFLSVCYGPWIWLCWMRARRGELHTAVLAGALLALTWLDGGAYVVMLLGALLAFQLLAEWRCRSWRHDGLSSVVTVIVALQLAAVKLLPCIEFMRMFPRPTDTRAGYSFWGLAYSLFYPSQTFASENRLHQTAGDFWRGFNFGLDENGMYVGVLAGGLFVLGLLSRPQRGLWIPLLLLAWLMWGDRVPWSLWDWMHGWVPFRWMRVAMRFRIAWLLPAAVLCGFGVQRLRQRLGSKGNSAACAVVVIMLVDLCHSNGLILSGAFPIAPFSDREAGEFVQVGAAPGYSAPENPSPYTPRFCWSSHYPLLLSNVGSVTGYEVIPIPKRAIPIDDARYRGEVYLLDESGSARFARWTPNVWEVEAQTGAPTRVVVNQNYYPGWHETANHWPVQPYEGLLSVEIPQGTHRLALAYNPPGFRIGLIITIVGAVFWPVVAVVLWLRDRRAAFSYELPQAFRMDGNDE
jgi:hypothetical protein